MENIVYENKTVRITDKHFVVGSKTYVLNNVTSTDLEKKGTIGAKIIGFLIFIGGLLLSTHGFNTNDFNILLTGIGVSILGSLFFLIKPTYSVILHTAGGENTAYVSKDKDQILEILKKLNQTIG